ncbi:MAG TPA: OsmC family protein [Chitinophagaceae bacterium]|nr:OsmC family protein [Chitinophagaceae bacterium]
MRQHHYTIDTAWTGNTGTGTTTYKGYERSHDISAPGKPTIAGSSDPAFRGDARRYNPEELLVAALSTCHMLSYLHVCAVAGIVVVEYKDQASGTMEETSNGSGHFTEVVLHPVVTITDASRTEEANQLHHRAHELCFIANSCNFPVKHQPVCNTL